MINMDIIHTGNLPLHAQLMRLQHAERSAFQSLLRLLLTDTIAASAGMVAWRRYLA